MFNNGDLIKEVKKISGIETQLDNIEQKKANNIDVRKKNILITEYDISDTLKRQITGNTPINNAIADKVVSPQKTTFLKQELIFLINQPLLMDIV